MRNAMFCPSCGVKEDQLTQFCRTCGTDLRVVRGSLEQADQATASSVAAREEVARAVAARIQEGQWWQVGAMVPEVERLFESPQMLELRLLREAEAQRLRRLRTGVITSAIGLGTILLTVLISLAKPDALLLLGPSVIVLLVGLGIVINGLLFTVPKMSRTSRKDDSQKQETFVSSSSSPAETTGDLASARPSFLPSTVTDHTTRHLSSELVKTPPRNNI